MFQLFDVLPANFFQIFQSSLKEIYAEILFSFYFKCEEENSYSVPKEDFIWFLENYFDERNINILEEDEELLKNSRDKANWVFRKLKAYGWVDTEFVHNQQQIVNLEDYAVAFLSTYAHFESNNDLELSSYVYRIYQGLVFRDPRRIYFILRDTLKQSNDLLRLLRSLNSNIKKYIKKIMKLNEENEEELLKSILNQLLNEYKLKIIDNAYFYMKTNDNPNKYKEKIFMECENIRNDVTIFNYAVEQIQKEEDITRDTAILKLEDILNEIELSFEKVIEIVTEIDNKNARYISVAIERIRILMNHDTNLEGYLLQILKNYNLLNIEDLPISITDQRNIVFSSLYTPRTTIKHQPTLLEENESGENFMDEKIFQQIKNNQKFSKQSIRKYVDDLLKTKPKISISDFNLKDNTDFVRLLLIFVYSESNQDCYKILLDEKEEKIGNYYVPKFSIERNGVK